MFEFNCVKKRPIACFFASFEGEKQEAGYYSLPLACVGFSALCRGRVIWWGGRAYLEMGSSIDLIYIFYRKNGLSHNPTPNPRTLGRLNDPLHVERREPETLHRTLRPWHHHDHSTALEWLDVGGPVLECRVR